jgi:hypothetical protein
MPFAGDGNNKGRNIVQTALLILVVLFIVIDRIVIPQVGMTKAAETNAQAAQRISDAVAIERRLTALETRYDAIERYLARIESKIDKHMDAGK